MTTGNVIAIFALILLLFAVDMIWLDGILTVQVGKGFVATVEYLSFWR